MPLKNKKLLAQNPSAPSSRAYVQALYKEKYGRNATKTEIDRFTHYGYTARDAANLILGGDSPFRQVSSNPPVPPVVAPPNTTPETQPVSQPLTYDEWIKSNAGQQYAVTDERLAQMFNPYYQDLAAQEDYQKQLATEQYGRNTAQTTENYGQNFNDRGIYGSGIYQQELGKALGELSRGYEQSYGTNPYSTYSQRKKAIEQQRLTAIEQARLARQNYAFNAYSQSYLPTVT